jgi:hypothetical protein
MIKDLKLKILICFNSLITEHSTPYLSYSFIELRDFFAALEEG